MCDYYFVCGVQRNCGSSRHFAMCYTLQKFARYSSSVFIFFSFKWHCKLLIITLLIKGKSCLTNLLETMDCIIGIIDQGDPIDIFYFDFKKAFDRVPHNRLLYKIECLGIKGKVLDIIRDFLTGRSFRVCVGGEFSNLKDVLSGIPQGSVLGPLLFVLYINDLPDSIKSFAKLFADDLKVIAKASDKLQVDNDFKMLEL